MQLFDNHVFTLNPNISWEYVDTPLAKLAIIDEFYEDIDAVQHELSKVPATKTAGHCDDVEDYRLSYINSMRGTDLPFTNTYRDVVSDIISCKTSIRQADMLAVNVNRLKTDRALSQYYNIHTDHDKSKPDADVVSTVVMLNDHYEDGEGTSFFYNLGNMPYWMDKDALEVMYFMQGKKNRAVVFSAKLNHGATYSTPQFMNEYRYSQAIFSDIT